MTAPRHLAVRWLGRVGYDEAWALQRGLHAHSPRNHLLLLEHPHVVTLGPRAPEAHILMDPAAAGAELCRTDRGGDVTYHGPGQLVGYPILTLGGPRAGGLGAAAAYVESLEDLLIEVLEDLGLPGAGRLERHRGVWLDPAGERPRKIAAIGVRVRRGRTLHGFALNVDPDLSWFGRIVPCGIREHPVTSLGAEGVAVTMREVVDATAARAIERWGAAGWDRADVAAAGSRRLVAASAVPAGTVPTAVEPDPGPPQSATIPVAAVSRAPESPADGGRKPSWMRVVARTGPEFRRIKSVMRDLDLVTVCEEAGCPNIYECWEQGTATFMLGGERCTRACGFCLIDTRRPEPLDPAEPDRVAAAVARMGLEHAVVTAVARDDVPDGGAAHFAACIRAIRRLRPSVTVEVLIPDCKGDPAALSVIFDERPDVLNHNIETVARLQRLVRPSAGYARSLAVLARASDAGLVTKSSIMVGLGETAGEVVEALGDLAGVGCDIVTIGQYLRPSSAHLRVERWWPPEDFEELARIGRELGIGHVESSPLTRSSYHAAGAARSVGAAAGGA
ncbi:MAG: lipoyl synthase [Acidimicrobiia bacterium]|nr:lipoyl synthase [Acidimicrobiia bacterium]MYC45656.1 lipoyl synthase [Acidimicrobiia bacterium]